MTDLTNANTFCIIEQARRDRDAALGDLLIAGFRALARPIHHLLAMHPHHRHAPHA